MGHFLGVHFAKIEVYLVLKIASAVVSKVDLHITGCRTVLLPFVTAHSRGLPSLCSLRWLAWAVGKLDTL